MRSPARWEIVNVQLAMPLVPLEVQETAAGTLAVFWWGEIPLGTISIRREEAPVSVIELRRRAATAIAPAVGLHVVGRGFLPSRPSFTQPAEVLAQPDFKLLAGLHQPLRRLDDAVPRRKSTPKISIVVCTRMRAEILGRCLASLERLRYPALEVIVVDNAPADTSTRGVMELFPAFQYVVEPRPGLSCARNRGVQCAGGDIIAFTDDDVVVAPNWPDEIARVLGGETVRGMTGLVLPAELESEAQIRFELDGWFPAGFRRMEFDGAFFDGMRDSSVPVWKIGAGANMAFQRSVFEEVGLFDERLGAGAAGCSEDSELWYRMLAARMRIVYDPRAIVHHYHRADAAALQRQRQHYMRGHVVALVVQHEKYGHRGDLRRLFRTLPVYYAKRALRARTLLDWRLVLRETAGCVSGLWAYFRLTRRLGRPPLPRRGPRVLPDSQRTPHPSHGQT